MSALTRRDFLNGVALSVGGALLSPRDALGLSLDDATGGPPPYPPALTGMRGSHDGSFEVAHALRDGSFWTTAGVPVDTGERYDLVVGGAGISGLAGRVVLQQGGRSVGAHPRARQPRRLRRPFWINGGPLPCVAARRPFGRIAIATPTPRPTPYTDAAIDQAYRAIREVLVRA